MNEESKLDAKKSLCWTCKHSLCLQETEGQTMMHEPVMPMPPKENDPFGQFDDAPPEESGGMPILEHVTLRRIQAICYWRPPTVQNSPPIRVAEVTQCNRYEKS